MYIQFSQGITMLHIALF